MLALLMGVALATPLPVLDTLESPRASEADLLGAGLTLHVLLQASPRNRGTEGTETSPTCASRIGETALALLDQGVRHVVVEGLSLGGDFLDPRASHPRKAEGAAATLSRIEALTLWGMEVGKAQPRNDKTWKTMLDSAAALKALRHDKETWTTSEERLARLYEIQRDLYPANTELVIANLPLRSFQALQVAFSVAEKTESDALMLVIGAKHWPDFEYALSTAARAGNDRHVAMRLVKYRCDDEPEPSDESD